VRNPWLDIPLADYEGHMALPGVGQAQLLSRVFADALAAHAPRSVAVIGCAGGNGFERVSRRVTQRVVGVDLNPEYVEQARVRFAHRLPKLELFVGDVQTDSFAFAPVDLAYAGLLFVYVELGAALAGIRPMLKPGGVLLSAVQLPSAAIAGVTPSPFASLGALSAAMHTVPPDELARAAAAAGFREVGARTVAASGGKEFRVQTFRLEAAGRRV
jgi:SAM-dependent methyltransferase